MNKPIKEFLNYTVRNIPPSGIRKFFDLVNEMKDVISLSIGEPDFITPWAIREAGIYSLEKGHTHYSPNAGYLELRKAISEYLFKKYNLNYNPVNEILVTVGASEAIDISLRAIINYQDEVIIPEPSFVSYKPCALFAGATVKTISLDYENGFRLKPEELEKLITNKTKALILPFPNNPTGSIMTKDDLFRIAEVLKNKDIIVISDEIYSELTYEGRHYSIAEIPYMKDKTILINGFSKAFAMTGWRLGYICAHKDLVSAIAKIHQYAIMCAPTVSQYAAIEALKNCDSDVEMMKKEYNHRRRIVIDGIKKAGLDCYEPLGAFYVFPSIKKTKLTSIEFCEKLLYEEKVALVPGSAFGENGEGYVRICYAYSIENIKEAMHRLQRFCKKLRDQSKKV